ncbi:LacI family DNA-binding transcriptional regulator [soil metagenome]
MASIKEVAERAQVSTASVSRVLAGKKVRPEVLKRVMKAVDALGYRPNRVARSLRSNKSTTIGLVVADIQNTYFTQICRAVEDTASRSGFAVFLCNSDEDPAKESTYLSLLRDENVAGAIVAPTAETIRTLQPEALLQLPLVMIDRHPGRLAVDSVVLDNVGAASELTAHLLTHGRRRIAGLFGANSATGAERHKGFLAAHHALKLEPIKELTRFVPPRQDDGYSAAKALLAMSHPPDALITSNGLLAAGAFRAIAESGLACPEKIAFASFDDTMWAPMVSPAVTVIEQPTYEIGQTATELLMARIQNSARAVRSVTLPYKLIPRQSCGCAR